VIKIHAVCNLIKRCWIIIKTNLCHGFLYETAKELREPLGIEEYPDMKFNKGIGDWEPDWEEGDDNAFDLSSSLAMDVYVKRKAEGLTQRELARKLGISLDTLSKIEKCHVNLQSKVKMK
jgi:ribosome-binding protein aMBF1 (putative translation factor)